MKTYQLKEPTVQAAQITGEQFTLDDGTTQTESTPDHVGDYFVVAADNTTSVVAKAEFEASYVEVTPPLA